jgi:hypothetical protein
MTTLFGIKQFGEETGSEIMEKAYPVLNNALASKNFTEHAMEVPTEPVEYGPRAKQILRKAVETERQRLKNFRTVTGKLVVILSLVGHLPQRTLHGQIKQIPFRARPTRTEPAR